MIATNQLRLSEQLKLLKFNKMFLQRMLKGNIVWTYILCYVFFILIWREIALCMKI